MAVSFIRHKLIQLKKKAGKLKRHARYFMNGKLSFLLDCMVASKRTTGVTEDSPEICIAISTTKTYAEKTIPVLIANLAKIGVPAQSVYVFEGGHDEKRMSSAGGYHHYFLDNNSFDITALIGIVEFNIDKNYWLLLHDTVALSRGFKNLFNAINPSGYDCMPLRSSPSMNIGIYSNKYLRDNKDYLLNFCNKDFSKEGLVKAKQRACKEEDFLFNKARKKMNIHSRLARFEYIKLVKYFGQLRLLEGYPQLGLLKYKANGSVRVMKDFPQLAKLHRDSDGLERTAWTIKL